MIEWLIRKKAGATSVVSVGGRDVVEKPVTEQIADAKGQLDALHADFEEAIRVGEDAAKALASARVKAQQSAKAARAKADELSTLLGRISE